MRKKLFELPKKESWATQVKKINDYESKERKDIKISFNVMSIDEIDVIKQRFSVRFTMFAEWDDSADMIDVSNSKKGKDPSLFDNEMFTWDPELEFLNLFMNTKDEVETWYNVLDPTSHRSITPAELENYKGGKVRILFCQKIQATFHEAFELRDFPFDFQHLHIGVTSRWDAKAVSISFHPSRSSRVSEYALTSQTYFLGAPRLLSHADDTDENYDGAPPLLSDKADSASRKRYCRAYMALSIARKPDYIIGNVMIILSLVGSLSFAAYSLDPVQNQSGRLSLIVTLVLTTVTFKNTVRNMMPEISYITLMDMVIYSTMILLAAMIVCICIAGNNDDPDELFDNSSAITLAGLWFLTLSTFVVKSFVLRNKRNKYMSSCEEKLFNQYFANNPQRASFKTDAVDC